jgi:hypothetical protein
MGVSCQRPASGASQVQVDETFGFGKALLVVER